MISKVKTLNVYTANVPQAKGTTQAPAPPGDKEKPQQSGTSQRYSLNVKVRLRSGAEVLRTWKTGSDQHLSEQTCVSPGPGQDVVRSSVTNSEHTEPTHSIKDIIKQYQPPPATKPAEIKRYIARTTLGLKRPVPYVFVCLWLPGQVIFMLQERRQSVCEEDEPPR